jgi:hypothetical protein
MGWGMNNNEGIKNQNVKHRNTVYICVEQPIPFFWVGGGVSFVIFTTVAPFSKIYWGTTVLFHDDNGPPSP